MAQPTLKVRSFMLTIRNFSKKYSDRLILSIPEMHLHEGVHWIKGENGSGKSTLFRAIAGLSPFDGEIILNNAITYRKNQKEYLQRLTYAEAEPLYPPFLSPRDVIEFVGSARRSPAKEMRTLVKQFGIDDYYFAAFQTCSSGMTKKVSLLLSFLGSPEIIVLDEPLITLDVDAQRTLLNLIDTTVNQGTLFLLSSHQMVSAANFTTTSYQIINKTLERI
jgi:ABC-2 type transport system ATP-binding protein